MILKNFTTIFDKLIFTTLCASFFLCKFILLPSDSFAENLKIGYIGSLTGDVAILGEEIVRSIQVAVEEVNQTGGINGRKLELKVEDDGYDIKRTLSAYEKLKSEINSNIIFMTTYGGFFALGKRPEKDGIVIIDTLDCNDSLVKTSQMHTCVATRTESIGESFIRKIKENGGGSVGVLYEQEAWFNFIVDTLRKGIGKDLVEVIAPASAPDYRAEVLKLKSAGVKHIVFLGNDAMGRAMTQLRLLEIPAPFYSIASVTSPGFTQLAGKSLNGTFVSNWLIPRGDQYKKLADEFKALHKKDLTLDFVAGPSYDAATLAFSVLRKLYQEAPVVSGKSIRDALTKEELNGVSGYIKMDPDGAVRSIQERIFRYEDGQLIDLK